MALAFLVSFATNLCDNQHNHNSQQLSSNNSILQSRLLGLTLEALNKMGLANHDLPPPPSGKYPAKAHARRVAEFIAENGGPKEGIIYLEAQKTAMVEVC
jgi:hypothetical protein